MSNIRLFVHELPPDDELTRWDTIAHTDVIIVGDEPDPELRRLGYEPFVAIYHNPTIVVFTDNPAALAGILNAPQQTTPPQASVATRATPTRESPPPEPPAMPPTPSVPAVSSLPAHGDEPQPPTHDETETDMKSRQDVLDHLNNMIASRHHTARLARKG